MYNVTGYIFVILVNLKGPIKARNIVNVNGIGLEGQALWQLHVGVLLQKLVLLQNFFCQVVILLQPKSENPHKKYSVLSQCQSYCSIPAENAIVWTQNNCIHTENYTLCNTLHYAVGLPIFESIVVLQFTPEKMQFSCQTAYCN